MEGGVEIGLLGLSVQELPPLSLNDLLVLLLSEGHCELFSLLDGVLVSG